MFISNESKDNASLATAVEKVRRRVNTELQKQTKKELGQYMTPMPVAKFMSSLFGVTNKSCRILDAGAGVGTLGIALSENMIKKGNPVSLTCCECDSNMLAGLRENCNLLKSAHSMFDYEICSGDFITYAQERQFLQPNGEKQERFTHVILNPPYRKLSTESLQYKRLLEMGIESANLYSAFVACCIQLMEDGAELCAIIPRSFCNGAYFKKFRKFILEHGQIDHIHLFKSRTAAFKEDRVLQENVIFHYRKGSLPSTITVSTSTDDTFCDLEIREHAVSDIIRPAEEDYIIFIPETNGEVCMCGESMLKDLGISVSTGPIVDFRLKNHLVKEYEEGCVPLLYPYHFSAGHSKWPAEKPRRFNAIKINTETRKWLYPRGYYTIVRRLSSKEEKRRIVASVVEERDFLDFSHIAFENHLNVFHMGKASLPEALARGLALYLNSSHVDDTFRNFNGNTQVNVSDLKLLRYPKLPELKILGLWSMQHRMATQNELDSIVYSILSKHEHEVTH